MDFPQLGHLEIKGSSGGEKVPPKTPFLIGPESTGVHHLLAKETFEQIIRLIVGIHDVESGPTQRLAKEGVVQAGYRSAESTQRRIETDHLIVIVEPKLQLSKSVCDQIESWKR